MKLKNKIFIVFTSVLILIFLYKIGIRITYNPKLPIDWQATGAIGQWASVIASIFVVYLSSYLTKKFNEKTKDVALSNAARIELTEEIEKKIFEEMKKMGIENEPEENFEDNIEIEKKIRKYIELYTVVSTEKLANHIKKNVEETYNYLCEMEKKNIVKHIGENSNLKEADFLWKSESH